MTVQLFFDTYENKDDVRKHTDKIADLMAVKIKEEGKGKKLRPPYDQVPLGPNWTFKAVITQMNQNFNLFQQNGTPVRATVDLTLQEVEDDKAKPGQNPTSGGDSGRRTHVVAAGETLDLIASQELGDSAALAQHRRPQPHPRPVEAEARQSAGRWNRSYSVTKTSEQVFVTVEGKQIELADGQLITARIDQALDLPDMAILVLTNGNDWMSKKTFDIGKELKLEPQQDKDKQRIFMGDIVGVEPLYEAANHVADDTRLRPSPIA